MKKYKIRFNLGRGENYLKWKITAPNGGVIYYEPKDVCIYMYNCKLVNQQGTAKKIFDGANKTVCAWIECEALAIFNPLDSLPSVTDKVSYNPRIQPNWVCDGEIVDKGSFDVLYTHESGVYHNFIDNLIDSVIDRIKQDITDGDLTAIDELLRFVPKENLIGFLPEKI